MFKASLPLVCTVAMLAASSLPALADSVTLKSGEVLEGQIVRESDTEVVIDAKVGSGITDQRVLNKSEVSSVQKTSPDEIAFQKVKDLNVGANSLLPANYRSAIAALGAFVKQFPISRHRLEVTNAIDALTAEKARVEAKELKWNNRWYSAQEVEQQKYQLRAQAILISMREQEARFATIAALNTFDRLEREFPGSEAYIDAVELASGLVNRLNAEIDRAVDSAKLQESQFKKGINLVPEPNKSEMINARAAQIAAAEEAVAKSTAKWKPLLPITDKSPQALKTTITSESQRLSQIPVAAMRNSVAAVEAANAALVAKNATEADTQAKLAQSLWPKYEALTRLLPAVEALKKAPTPTPTPSPAPTGKPGAHAKAKTSPTPAPTK